MFQNTCCRRTSLTALWLIAFVSGASANGPTPAAGSLEYRFYGGGEAEGNVLLEVANRADRKLRCDKDWKFIIGMGSRNGTTIRFTKFKFSEIEHFLKSEKHKGILVIWLEKDIMAEADSFIETFTQKLREMTSVLGYQRVLILGSAGNGVHYLFDSKNEAGGLQERGRGDE